MTTPGMLVISRLSTEYLVVPVTATVDGEIFNPTGDTVEFAFTMGYGITPVTWITGNWDPDLIQGIWYNAKVLIGPANGGTVLAAGTYTVWIKIIDFPEQPVRQAGTIVIQ